MAWNHASNSWEDISIYGLQVKNKLTYCFTKRHPSSWPHHISLNDVTVTIDGYIFMYFRFGKVADQKGALRLYTVQIPHKRDRKPPPCYLTKWDGKSFLPMLTAPCGTEVISSLAVRLLISYYTSLTMDAERPALDMRKLGFGQDCLMAQAQSGYFSQSFYILCGFLSSLLWQSNWMPPNPVLSKHGGR